MQHFIFLGRDYNLDVSLIPRSSKNDCATYRERLGTCTCDDHCSWDLCRLSNPPDDCLLGTNSKWKWDKRKKAYVAQIMMGMYFLLHINIHTQTNIEALFMILIIYQIYHLIVNNLATFIGKLNLNSTEGKKVNDKVLLRESGNTSTNNISIAMEHKSKTADKVTAKQIAKSQGIVLYCLVASLVLILSLKKILNVRLSLVFIAAGNWYELGSLDIRTWAGILASLGSLFTIYLFYTPRKVSNHLIFLYSS